MARRSAQRRPGTSWALVWHHQAEPDSVSPAPPARSGHHGRRLPLYLLSPSAPRAPGLARSSPSLLRGAHVQIEFSGAAREVTGSCHILRVGGKTILLDCGLYQGQRRESDAKNRKLPVPVEAIDAIVLSHAHI